MEKACDHPLSDHDEEHPGQCCDCFDAQFDEVILDCSHPGGCEVCRG